MEELYPEIELESDEILMVLTIKKDYSDISDENLRKKELFDNLKEIIREFEESEESNELIKYF